MGGDHVTELCVAVPTPRKDFATLLAVAGLEPVSRLAVENADNRWQLGKR